MKRFIRLCALPILLLALPLAARAQIVLPNSGPDMQGEVHWQFSGPEEPVRPAGSFLVEIVAAIDKGWNVYAMDSPAGRPLSIRFDELPAAIEQDGDVRQSQPQDAFDPNFKTNVTYFSEVATLHAPFRIAGNASPGLYEITGGVTFMMCNERICLPPTTRRFTVPVRVGP